MASELRRLTRALAFAAEGHRNHRRKGASQEPYINHLIEVAELVASVEGGDMDVLIAALLHDVLEDTRTGYDELAAAFGERVARIVQENSDDMTLPKPERQRARLAGIDGGLGDKRLVFAGGNQFPNAGSSHVAAAIELITKSRRQQNRDELVPRRLNERATAGEVNGIAGREALK